MKQLSYNSQSFGTFVVADRKKLCCVVVSLIIGLVFLYQGFLKIISPQETVDALGYILSSSYLAAPATAMLIGFEFLVGAAFFMFFLNSFVILASAVAMILFSGWIIYLQITDLPIDCGCGKALVLANAEEFGLARNGIVLAAIAYIWTQRDARSNVEIADKNRATLTGRRGTL